MAAAGGGRAVFMNLHTSVLALVAPGLWLITFLLLYGFNALACVEMWPRLPVVAVHLALTVAALAVQAWLLRHLARRRSENFYAFLGLGLGGLTVLATVLVGLMALVVPTC